MIKNGIKYLICMMILAFSFISCTKIQPVTKMETEQEKQTIITTTSIPTTLHASSYHRARDEDFICAVFEGLVELTNSSSIGPSIANGWKISNDKLQYNFIINKDAFWSDGEKIVAEDFVNYFEHLFSPSNNNYTSDELYSIYGVEDYKKGIIGFDEVGIYVNEENELVFRLLKVDDKFLEKLTKPEYRLRNTEDELENYAQEYNSIRYTGKYKIGSVNPYNEVELVSNSKFLSEEDTLDNIILKVTKDTTKDFASFATGKIDVVTNPPISALDNGNLKNQVYYTSGNNLQYLVFNTTTEIGKYLDFRKGIYIDLEQALMESYLIKNNFATQSFKVISMEEIEESFLYKEKSSIYNENLRSNNLQMAKSFFNGVGIEDTYICNVVGSKTYENQKLAEFLEEEFKLLGINIKINLLSDTQELYKLLEKGRFDIFIDNINLDDENINNKIGSFKEFYIDNEYSVLALYLHNNYWCKSENLKNLYIDGNGNLILRKIKVNKDK
ncbi:MAG: ABC transporter substrate-binding protein [Sarcina sp.]